ncbi:MAG: hypothetical protein J0653_00860, partial [Deltaproteobacteria bacterium]|nr:hypothetical protein [Deltaproteobacteria bacterium]
PRVTHDCLLQFLALPPSGEALIINCSNKPAPPGKSQVQHNAPGAKMVTALCRDEKTAKTEPERVLHYRTGAQVSSLLYEDMGNNLWWTSQASILPRSPLML